jgi:hypothetical protein
VSRGEKVFFFLFFVLFSQAREAAKSGLVLFHEAMDALYSDDELEEAFGRFETAAAKGHEESVWIGSVVKDVEMTKSDLKKTFAQTEKPLGWWAAAMLSELDSREEFDFFKKSAEGGCSWGQLSYAWFFHQPSNFVAQDRKAYVEWLEKAARQDNPLAFHWLGDWFGKRLEGNDKEKEFRYVRRAAELGMKSAMIQLAMLFSKGDGCVKDLRLAAIWSAKGKDADVSDVYQKLLLLAKDDFEEGCLGPGLDQFCCSLGWGLYWHLYGSEDWDDDLSDPEKAFANSCLDYYCATMDLHQKSILTFLLCWKHTVGVNDVGVMIGKMIWKERVVWLGGFI